MFNEKRSDLEEQQLHLNVGLQKIRETVSQVEELQKSLSLKGQELEAKNALANQKLKQMLTGKHAGVFSSAFNDLSMSECNPFFNRHYVHAALHRCH